MQSLGWRATLFALFAFAALLAANAAIAQDRGTLNPQPLPPLAKPDDPATPAKELFGRKTAPAPLEARTIGFYSKGCLAGAKALPINGKTWQVMRLVAQSQLGPSRAARASSSVLANQAPKTGWRGLLVGDMSQPRGGPMRTGHASHQVGLDADIWLTPMPDRELTRLEREEMSATMVVAEDRKDVDPERVDAGARGGDQGGRKRPRGRAASSSTRPSNGRYAATPAARPRLAEQGAALVGTRLSFPHPHSLPGRQPRLQGPGADAGE